MTRCTKSHRPHKRVPRITTQMGTVDQHGKEDDVDVFHMNVSRQLPTLPRLMLKEASRIQNPLERRNEIARVTRYVIINYPQHFREEVRL